MTSILFQIAFSNNTAEILMQKGAIIRRNHIKASMLQETLQVNSIWLQSELKEMCSLYTMLVVKVVVITEAVAMKVMAMGAAVMATVKVMGKALVVVAIEMEVTMSVEVVGAAGVVVEVMGKEMVMEMWKGGGEQ